MWKNVNSPDSTSQFSLLIKNQGDSSTNSEGNTMLPSQQNLKKVRETFRDGLIIFSNESTARHSQSYSSLDKPSTLTIKDPNSDFFA